jgi:hypothetical protein
MRSTALSLEGAPAATGREFEPNLLRIIPDILIGGTFRFSGYVCGMEEVTYLVLSET